MDEDTDLMKRAREYQRKEDERNDKIWIFVIGFVVAAWLVVGVMLLAG